MFFDPLYLILSIPFLLFSMYAQHKVKSTFNKYAEVGVRSGMTGAEAARAIIRASGMEGVGVERHQGFLSDHYDPRAKMLRLSPHVHDGRSISSIAVAAHEAGHSLQDAKGYGPLQLRSKLVPAVQLGSRFWFLPFMAGAMLNMAGLMVVGIVLFSGTVLFQLVTLPTEFDASKRAKAVLASTGIVTTEDEARGVDKVLDAAAMTYVAALAASVGQLIYLVLRVMATRGRD